MTAAPMTTLADIGRFIWGGDAHFTLKSKRSGHHYTYNFTNAVDRDGKATNRFFVSVLTDGSNYTYAGVVECIGGAEFCRFRTTKKSKLTIDAPSIKALTWFLGWAFQRGTIPTELEVWHEGKCCKCARPLTDPDSIALGIGPTCGAEFHANRRASLRCVAA